MKNRWLAMWWLIMIGLTSTVSGQSYDQSWALHLQHEHRGQSPEISYRSMATAEVDVHFYRCKWQIDPAVKYIRGAVTIAFSAQQNLQALQFDLNPVLRVDSILFRGRKQTYQQAAPQLLRINLESSLVTSQRDSVIVFYQGVPADGDFGSFVQMVKPNGVPVIWTLSQPYGSKDWWPCKNGQQDKADSMDIEITHPSQYFSTTNGVQWRKVQNGTQTTTYWRHRYPIASYLVAIAVSNYQQFKDSVVLPTGTLPIWLNAYQETGAGLDFSMQVAKSAMVLFTRQMGDYPFWKEGYTQTQFSRGGGMEHQTNSFIERNNTDLVVHELIHQWFGDKVTCNSWEDIWLNEGFATYGHYLYMEQFDTARKIPHLNYINDLICSEPGGSLKVRDTVQAEKIFDFRLSYCKGSALLHMLRWTIGDTAFFRVLRQYHQDPNLAFSTSRTRDFQRIAESVSGRSLQTFFQQWFEREGHPSYQIRWWINAEGRTVCKIDQQSSHPSVNFFEMSLPLHFSNGTKDTILRVDHLFSGQQFVLAPGFVPTQLQWDPKRWLIASKVSIEKVNAPTSSNTEISLYPIPAPQQLNLVWKNPKGKQLQVSIYQSNGQLLYQQSQPNNGSDWLLRIPTQTWSSGIYWLKTSSDGTLQSVKKWSK